MYEDDGLTRDHRKGVFAKTLIEVDATTGIQITINAAKGDFEGKNKQRVYLLDVHNPKAPKKVSVNGKKLKAYNNLQQFEKASTGYFFNANDRSGTVHIKTNYLSTSANQTIALN
ncbi:DUF5110 domain-containing protein [Pedobacter panaciterrae]